MKGRKGHKEKSLLNNHSQASQGAVAPRQPCSTRSQEVRIGELGASYALSDLWKDGKAHYELAALYICDRAASRAANLTSSRELSSKTVRPPAAPSWSRDKISGIWN